MRARIDTHENYNIKSVSREATLRGSITEGLKGLTMPSNSQIHPDGVTDAQENEVAARVTRRRFTAAQKARILDEYEHASAIERAAICRREHIYSSHLSNWRKQRAIGKPLEAKRGRRADPQAVEITQLRKRNVDLEQRLAKAEQVIDVQGKVYRWTCRRGRSGEGFGRRR
jgi:transposase